jgi:hypothetical protein
MAAKKSAKGAMSAQHKAALAEGRAEGRVVREYLEAVRSTKGRPGRKRTPDSISKRLAALGAEMAAASPVRELELVQERIDLERELSEMSARTDLSAIEARFVEVAAAYSARRGISYAAWRAVGVDAAVLKKAGIGRGG